MGTLVVKRLSVYILLSTSLHFQRDAYKLSMHNTYKLSMLFGANHSNRKSRGSMMKDWLMDFMRSKTLVTWNLSHKDWLLTGFNCLKSPFKRYCGFFIQKRAQANDGNENEDEEISCFKPEGPCSNGHNVLLKNKWPFLKMLKSTKTCLKLGIPTLKMLSFQRLYWNRLYNLKNTKK